MVAKKRRILFATPNYHCGVVEVAGAWPPLVFVYLGAQAEKAGWEAHVYDAMTMRDGPDEIEAYLRDQEFDVFATTSITPTFPDAELMCGIAKKVNPSCTTVMGGVHPTFMAGDVLREFPSIDYVIAGEGEKPLHDFLANFDDESKRHETASLVYRDGDEVKQNRSCGLLDDLDELPTSFDLLDWDLYKYYVIPKSKLGAISTSRGCNHGCTFCSQQRFWQKTWRSRKPEAIVAEMKKLHDEVGINVFLLTDEYPTRDHHRWEEFLDRIIAAKLDSYLLMETRVEDIVRDEHILPKYREAGIIHVYVGAEATDQATLDRINKEIDISESRYAIELIARHGMISETSFVLGFPEETAESIETTFQQAREFNPDFAHFLAITPWPYAEIYQEMQPHIEDWDFRNYNLIEPVIKPINMSTREIDRAIIDCYRRFYMPKMIEFHAVKDPFRRDYLLRSTKLIMKSSFLIKKFARLGVNPVQMMKDVMASHGAPEHKI